MIFQISNKQDNIEALQIVAGNQVYKLVKNGCKETIANPNISMELKIIAKGMLQMIALAETTIENQLKQSGMIK